MGSTGGKTIEYSTSGQLRPREVCEHALAHSLPDKVEAAYRRGDLLEKRMMLMQAWTDYCEQTPFAADTF